MRYKEVVVTVMREPKPSERRLIDAFFTSVGFAQNPYSSGLKILDPGGPFREAFYIPPEARQSVSRLPFLYSAGLNLGMLEAGRFTPSLHLARELSPLCGRPVRCSKLSPKGEQLFLYGREVYGSNVISFSRGVVLVVGASGGPLGWGEGWMVGGVPHIKPIRDLGWYLRRGG